MTRLGLLLACVLLAAAPAQAVTITVTEGAFFIYLFDTRLQAGGPVLTLAFDSPFTHVPQPVGSGLLLTTYELASQFGGTNGTVTVNGESCTVLGIVGGPSCGSLTFLSVPTAEPPADWLPAHAFESFLSPAVPFVMLGHVNIGPGFDVVGSGTVDTLTCFANFTGPCAPGGYAFMGSGAPVSRFAFASVPEPSTAALLVTGSALLTALMLMRRW
jgi:hypothetical protein